MRRPNGRAAVNRVFGNPSKAGKVNPAWVKKNLVRVALPYTMYYRGQAVKMMQVHRLVVEPLLAALNRVLDVTRGRVKEEYGYNHVSEWYDQKVREILHELHLDTTGGMFCFRAIRGESKLSLHAYGIAIDIDPAHNAMGHEPGMPQWFVDSWEDVGWVWGGHFKRLDGMHFQYASGC